MKGRQMVQRALVDLVEWLPQGRLSRAWGWLVRQPRPRWAVQRFMRLYARALRFDLSSAAQPLSAYPHLEALFVRQLKPGLRPVDTDPHVVVSPVDGYLGQCGYVQQDQLLQIKGHSYSLTELLQDAPAARQFAGGVYMTLYLAPQNYHRIHAPLTAQIVASVAIPGALRPVFPVALQRTARLLARNERLITYLEAPTYGRLALVKVGATLVGRISLYYDTTVQTNQAGKRRLQRRDYVPALQIAKGDALGAFGLGSTVVLLFTAGAVTLPTLPQGSALQYGSVLCRQQGLSAVGGGGR